jgi:hypothetical protein
MYSAIIFQSCRKEKHKALESWNPRNGWMSDVSKPEKSRRRHRIICIAAEICIHYLFP